MLKKQIIQCKWRIKTIVKKTHTLFIFFLKLILTVIMVFIHQNFLTIIIQKYESGTFFCKLTNSLPLEDMLQIPLGTLMLSPWCIRSLCIISRPFENCSSAKTTLNVFPSRTVMVVWTAKLISMIMKNLLVKTQVIN